MAIRENAIRMFNAFHANWRHLFMWRLKRTARNDWASAVSVWCPFGTSLDSIKLLWRYCFQNFLDQTRVILLKNSNVLAALAAGQVIAVPNVLVQNNLFSIVLTGLSPRSSVVLPNSRILVRAKDHFEEWCTRWMLIAETIHRVQTIENNITVYTECQRCALNAGFSNIRNSPQHSELREDERTSLADCGKVGLESMILNYLFGTQRTDTLEEFDWIIQITFTVKVLQDDTGSLDCWSVVAAWSASWSRDSRLKRRPNRRTPKETLARCSPRLEYKLTFSEPAECYVRFSTLPQQTIVWLNK